MCFTLYIRFVPVLEKGQFLTKELSLCFKQFRFFSHKLRSAGYPVFGFSIYYIWFNFQIVYSLQNLQNLVYLSISQLLSRKKGKSLRKSTFIEDYRTGISVKSAGLVILCDNLILAGFQSRTCIPLSFLEPYTIVIAPCTHVSKHRPQSLHFSSVTNETSLSLREIARTGHSPIQLPQPAQESALIFATMIFHSLFHQQVNFTPRTSDINIVDDSVQSKD